MKLFVNVDYYVKARPHFILKLLACCILKPCAWGNLESGAVNVPVDVKLDDYNVTFTELVKCSSGLLCIFLPCAIV